MDLAGSVAQEQSNGGAAMIGQLRLPINPEQVNPCPRCGGTHLYIYEGKSPKECGFIHICDDGDYSVKVESRLFETEQEAIKAWNKRI